MDPEEARVPKSMSYDLNRSNALSHHVPTLDAIEGYNLDADLLDAFFDPMAPIDFGSIDLDQITGYPREISTSEGDFGVVPIEPIRDGMVPQLQHSTQQNEAVLPLHLPLPPIITTGSTGFAPIAISGQKKASPDSPTTVSGLNSNAITTGGIIKEEEEEEEGGKLPPPSPSLGVGRRERQKNRNKQKPPPTLHRTKATGFFEDLRKREDIIARWREKKARRTYNRPKVQYESRKRTALEKCRVNGKFVKPEIYKAYVEAQEQSSRQGLHTVPIVTPAAAADASE